jgi:hypothetical protein
MMREGVGFILACIRMTEPYTKKQLMLSLASIFIDQDQIMPNTTSSEGSLNMVMNKQHNVNLVYVILQSIRRIICHIPDPESLRLNTFKNIAIKINEIEYSNIE